MATVINNPNPRESTVVQSDSSGWVIAIVILLIVIVGGAFWYSRNRTAAPQDQQPGATVNVTLPAGNSTGGEQPAP